ncbi:unnamed protein product, partial [Mesorhabditis spiculigera]
MAMPSRSLDQLLQIVVVDVIEPYIDWRHVILINSLYHQPMMPILRVTTATRLGRQICTGNWGVKRNVVELRKNFLIH